MTAHRTQRGFTIIELMTVVIIAAILLAIAAPAFNDMLARRRLEGQANELVIDLAYAKSEAVQRNRNVELLTGGGGTCYTVAAMNAATPPVGNCDCSAAPGSRCTVAGTAELKTVTLTGGVVVGDGISFQFEPVRGALVTAPASATVTLGSRSYTVSVAANGRVAPFTP
jgi:prepilin-type N-terminal cleavage/methylation domain-containing protein